MTLYRTTDDIGAWVELDDKAVKAGVPVPDNFRPATRRERLWWGLFHESWSLAEWVTQMTAFGLFIGGVLPLWAFAIATVVLGLTVAVAKAVTRP